jgi:hypothetical protein
MYIAAQHPKSLASYRAIASECMSTITAFVLHREKTLLITAILAYLLDMRQKYTGYFATLHQLTKVLN